jgi:hypothetical protein
MWSEDNVHEHTGDSVSLCIQRLVSVCVSRANEAEIVVYYGKGGLGVGEVRFGDRRPIGCSAKLLQSYRCFATVLALVTGIRWAC